MRSIDLAGLRAGQAVNMTIDAARSSLTPAGYSYGGLMVHGMAGTMLWVPGDTAWTKLATASPNGAGLWRGESFTTTDKLDYLGVSNDTTMTLWFEGEVWLDANSTQLFTLTGNDLAFVEIARPGATAYTRIIESGAPPAAVATPDTGWYPIRIGFSNGDGVYAFSFSHSEFGGGPVPWTRDRLRSRASEVAGTMRTVFGHRLLGGGLGTQPPVVHIEAGNLMTTTTFTPPPQGAGNDLWSARYAGQVYIDQQGSYVLKIDSDDGNRGRLDTQRDAVNWGNNGRPGSLSVPASLNPGWNDLFVDYDQNTGNRSLRVQLARPDGTTQEISPDHLRPVESFDDRLVSSSNDTLITVPDNGGKTNPGAAALVVAGYPGELVGSIDVTFFVASGHTDQLTADLETPAGTRVQIRGHAQIDNMQGAQVTILSTAADATATLLGGPAKGVWKLDVYEDTNGSGGGSQITSAKLTLHTQAGPDKLARTASWTSAVIDATRNAFAVDSVTWNDRVPTGATVAVALATCQHADCSDAAWSDPLTPAAAFAITPARYLQLRVDMTSDGNREPELQSLGIAFRRDP